MPVSKFIHTHIYIIYKLIKIQFFLTGFQASYNNYIIITILYSLLFHMRVALVFAALWLGLHNACSQLIKLKQQQEYIEECPQGQQCTPEQEYPQAVETIKVGQDVAIGEILDSPQWINQIPGGEIILARSESMLPGGQLGQCLTDIDCAVFEGCSRGKCVADEVKCFNIVCKKTQKCLYGRCISDQVRSQQIRSQEEQLYGEERDSTPAGNQEKNKNKLVLAKSTVKQQNPNNDDQNKDEQSSAISQGDNAQEPENSSTNQSQQISENDGISEEAVDNSSDVDAAQQNGQAGGQQADNGEE